MVELLNTSEYYFFPSESASIMSIANIFDAEFVLTIGGFVKRGRTHLTQLCAIGCLRWLKAGNSRLDGIDIDALIFFSRKPTKY